MSAKRWVSWLLVAMQFAALILIALTGPLLARHPLLLALEIAGIALALWAVVAMRLDNFNVLPDLKAGARLVRSGPYALLRHPIYSGLLLASGALALDAPTWMRGGFWLALLVDLILKLNYEERMLAQAFDDYADYRQTSNRLIPWLY